MGFLCCRTQHWIVADGGADLDIAEAYYQARNGGTNFNGKRISADNR